MEALIEVEHVPLTLTEEQQLAADEAVIERGQQTFVEVGLALADIRDNRLFRHTHRSFDEYCRDRWGFGRSNAGHLIRGAGVVQSLAGQGNALPFLPTSVRHTIPLASLPPEQQHEAWQRAIETAPDGKMTREHIADVVQEIRRPMDVHYSSGTPEWYTPQHIIDCVVEFFDQIDLDPCSNTGDPNVPAAHAFTERDNGLGQRWFGRVYMNPPYGDSIGLWTSKLVAHYENRDIEAGIALLPARTDTEWFNHFRGFTVCFIRGRLKFVGAENSAPFPSMLVYVGDEVDRFAQVMAPLGRVMI